MQKNRLSLSLILTIALLFALPGIASAVSLNPVQENLYRPEYIDRTEYILVQDQDSRLYGVYDTAGQQIIPSEYGYLDSLSYGYFEAINEEGLNNHALLSAAGEEIIDYQYAAFEMLSPKFCAAVVLEPTEGEMYDYAGGLLGGGEHYLVTRYDVYNLETAAMIGSLERAQYQQAMVHGNWLYIEDREGNAKIYDETLTPLDVEVQYLSCAYEVSDDNLVRLSDGKVILEDCSNFSEDLDSNTLRVWRSSGVGLCDLEGNPLIPAEYEKIGMVYGHYAPVVQDGLMGLYDLAAGALVVPCEYDDIPYTMAGGEARYEFNGYVLVKKDDKLGFSNTSGEITCEIKYPANTVTQHGCSLSVVDMDGSLHLIAGDGVQTKLDVSEIDKYSSGLGDLLIVSKDEKSGVIDWHGEEVLPLEYASYDLLITESGSAVLDQSAGTLYGVTR